MKSIIFLMGPTASGKTQLAMEFASQYPCEIVSVDSALVYRGMDIGTAKPTLELREKIPHHLIDICDPKESYSAGQFRRDVLELIKAIHARGKTPLLVGGTMLYFRSLQQGLADLPSANPLIRQKLQQKIQQQGLQALYLELKNLDPIAANRIHPNDSQRIQRALEVPLQTGKTLTQLLAESTSPLAGYTILPLAIAVNDRKVLHEQIAKRFDYMLDNGLIEEVKRLYERGDLNADLPAIRAVNYRQVWGYLAGQLTLDEMRLAAIAATRQLAKRQLTWLRGWDDLTWIEGERDLTKWLSPISLKNNR